MILQKNLFKLILAKNLFKIQIKFLLFQIKSIIEKESFSLFINNMRHIPAITEKIKLLKEYLKRHLL